MKLNRLETHDRLLYLKQDQALNINQGAEDCLKRNPLSLGLQQYSPYIYVFAHPRTADDGVNKRMVWQPRLAKPRAEPNSYCFRAQSHSDNIEMCWMIPPKELWPQYKKGNITEHELVLWSIGQYQHNRHKLEAAFDDDLPEEKCKEIYRRVAREMDEQQRIDDIYNIPTQKFSAASSLSPSKQH